MVGRLRQTLPRTGRGHILVVHMCTYAHGLQETIYYEGNWQEQPKKVQDYVSGEQTLYLPAYQAPPPVPQSTPVGTPGVDGPAAAAEQPLGDHPTVEEQINKHEYEPTPTSEQRRWSAPHTDWEPAR